MQQRRLGRTGLKVSRLALGIWSWGRDTDEHEAREQLVAYTEAGGNFVDTAAGYGSGASEEALGALIGDVVDRDDLLISTKAGVGIGRDGRRFDASRGYLLSTLDASLRRLGTDHVDLWQVHVWSDETPLEETLSALDHAVATGRAAYVGVSNYSGWQSAQAATWQRAVPGRFALASNQVEYSLLNRRPEAEVVPAARRVGARTARLVTVGPRRADREVPPRHAGGLPCCLAAPRRVRPEVPRRPQRAGRGGRQPGRGGAGLVADGGGVGLGPRSARRDGTDRGRPDGGAAAGLVDRGGA